ncbi:DEAD-domain-containing protein [Cristinia sonorae]|uniref:RNA helicase n=1 Tax=Cristinia sonorae TaxID=1940300 RepID=A0A8K0XS70_9AGAR|nr:DEAD-domain-containing protein [Cristinia sonorae]
MTADDFIMTMDSDVEDQPVAQPSKSKSKKQRPDAEEEAQLNPEFSFDLSAYPYEDLMEEANVRDYVKAGSKPTPISVDEIIERRRLSKATGKRKRDAEASESEEDADDQDGSIGDDDDDDDDEEESIMGEESEEEEEDPLATSDEDGDDAEGNEDEEDVDSEEDGSGSTDEDSEEETQAEKNRKTAFFAAEEEPSEAHTSFLTMNLSRPIHKAITGLGFLKPTPIQAATIPVALLGKDVVGNAVTGSGKTAAFIIPMIERLLYREKGMKAAATRCLVLVPTRELGVQCFEVGTKLAAHTDIRFCLVVGGLSVKAQEAALRTRPDVIIATPGRLIDHLRNSHSFTLDTLDILVLDEADRMLSDGFADELAEIIKSCPTSRQTMLFSATMTDSVDELVRMSLNKPVRLFVDPKRSTARGLIQEFVRVRAGKESERSALLVALCKRSFKNKVVIFFRSKKLAHQLRIVFSLLDMKCSELHGDLSQEQRLSALHQFRDGSVDYLMATDLASRGLDIKGIETVINYDMPGQLAQYLHRVGRTARAGRQGRSVTLVGEADRKMLKAAIKHASGEDMVRHRQVPAETVAKWSQKLEGLKSEISAVMDEEKEEKQLRRAEMEIKKGQNLIEHEAEIYSRPARTWFQSEKEKEKASAISKEQYEMGFKAVATGKKALASKDTGDKPKRDKFAGLTRRAKRRKMAMEEDEEHGESRAIKAAVRSAKKAQRPAKIGLPEKRLESSKAKAKAKKAKRVVGRQGDRFDKDMGQKGSGSSQQGPKEGVRAKKGDVIGGMRKKGGKKK